MRELGLGGWTESEVVGHGRAASGHAVPHARFEVIVAAENVFACTDAIAAAAHTGEDGDGVLAVLPVQHFERIRTRVAML